MSPTLPSKSSQRCKDLISVCVRRIRPPVWSSPSALFGSLEAVWMSALLFPQPFLKWRERRWVVEGGGGGGVGGAKRMKNWLAPWKAGARCSLSIKRKQRRGRRRAGAGRARWLGSLWILALRHPLACGCLQQRKLVCLASRLERPH